MHMARRAGAHAAARMIQKDPVVLGDVEEAHRLAVPIVRQRAERELDRLVLRAKGNPDHVFGWRFGEIDLRERLGLRLGHMQSQFSPRSTRRAVSTKQRITDQPTNSRMRGSPAVAATLCSSGSARPGGIDGTAPASKSASRT